MLLIDCSDCFTRIEFTQSTVEAGFDQLQKFLVENKSKITMFAVDDYIFEFVEYVSEAEIDTCSVKGECDNQWVIGKYITPVPHLTYMVEDEVWFKVTPQSASKFTFFFDDEIVVSMHGMLFWNGEFKENLIHKYNITEIRNLNNELCNYIMKKYNEDKQPIYIWNSFKCIGIQTEVNKK